MRTVGAFGLRESYLIDERMFIVNDVVYNFTFQIWLLLISSTLFISIISPQKLCVSFKRSNYSQSINIHKVATANPLVQLAYHVL